MPRRPPELPDVRDGLTHTERTLLRVLAEAEAEHPGRSVASAELYGRLQEHVALGEAEFMALLRKLVGAR